MIAIAIFFVAPVYFSLNPSTPGWVGFDNSKEKSQVAIEEVKGKIKTTETTKFEQAKTLWDWLSLLGAPATLAVFGFWFQFSQERAKVAREKAERDVAEATKLRVEEQAKAEKKRAEEQAKAEKERAEEQAKSEKDRAEDRQRDDALEAYINNVSDLLVGKNLSTLAKQKIIGTTQYGLPGFLDVSMEVIRARTLLILRRFMDDKDQNRTNGERKGSILLFLYDTELLRNLKKGERGKGIDPIPFQALLSLKGANLVGANLVGANLSGANLSGVVFTEAYLSSANLGGVVFREAKLIGANLSGANLHMANFINATLISANLISALLDEASLVCADLRDADLADANLFDADLSSASLFHANLSGAILNKANLMMADLTEADLSDTDLRDATLSHAHLRDANLSRADLSGADLSGVDLSGAILLGVDLSSVKLSTLTQEQLEGEKQPLLCKVKLPKNIDVDPNRDCKDLPQVLLNRYPTKFKNLAEAQAYVYEQSML